MAERAKRQLERSYMARINKKRINQPRETAFSGVRGNMAYQTAFEVSYHEAKETDVAGHPMWVPLGSPVVSLTPVDRKSKPWDDRRFDFPVENLDEVIQALEVIREEVQRGGQSTNDAG